MSYASTKQTLCSVSGASTISADILPCPTSFEFCGAHPISGAYGAFPGCDGKRPEYVSLPISCWANQSLGRDNPAVDLCHLRIWEVSQIRSTILEVPMMGIVVFGGLYWGPPIFGSYHICLFDVLAQSKSMPSCPAVKQHSARL